MVCGFIPPPHIALVSVDGLILCEQALKILLSLFIDFHLLLARTDALHMGL